MNPGTDMDALAEENNRLRRELDTLKVKHAPKPKKPHKSRVVDLSLILAFLTAISIVLLAKTCEREDARWTPDKKAVRTSACYFVEQYEGEREILPWSPWWVWQTKYDGFPKGGVKGPFATKAEAWDFLQKWNLPACR